MAKLQMQAWKVVDNVQLMLKSLQGWWEVV